jgi:type IV secretion system protein TrbJ
MTSLKLAHALVTALIITGLATAPVRAQQIVLDPMNLIENTITSIQSLSQYAKQAEQYLEQVKQFEEQVLQYETQLQQFATELQNTLTLPQFFWSDASGVISKLLAAGQLLSNLQNQLGGLEAYLSQYHNLQQFEQLFANGITPASLQQLRQVQLTASQAEQAANADAVNLIAQQRAALQADAISLAHLQHTAQDAQGQMQALQAGNQLSSEIVNQLQQLRGCLLTFIAQQTTASQNQAANWAASQAASEAATRVTLPSSASINYNPFQ